MSSNVTYKFRVKDKHQKYLTSVSRSVNFVWNYCNETQKKAVKSNRRWLSYLDFQELVKNSSSELGILSTIIRASCAQYVNSRIHNKRPWLRWRGRKSLGWIPLQAQSLKVINNKVILNKITFDCWYSRSIPQNATICDGSSFSQDASGRWYVNLVLEIPIVNMPTTHGNVGIDLGLKSMVTTSDGCVVPVPRMYRRQETRLRTVARAKKRRLLRAVNCKIKNQRKDFLHKTSTNIVNKYERIFVGDVSSSKLAKTSMAKSVYDVGWYAFKQMLRYKATRHGHQYLEVNERYSTQTCSNCLTVCGPKSREGLVVREWVCSSCGEHHDRDINAAKNILRLGHETLTGAVVSRDAKRILI